MSRKEIDRYYHVLRLRNNFLDLFSASRYALKFKIIFIGFVGILISYFFSLAGSFLTVSMFTEYHNNFIFVGIIPVVIPNIDLPILANVILFIGYILAISSTLITSSIIAITITEYLKGDRDFSDSNIQNFLNTNFTNILFAPIGFVVIIMFFFALSILLALLTKLPVIGLLLYFFLIPVLCLIGMFLVYTILAMINGLLFLPSIAATWGQDMMGIIFQSYSILWARPCLVISGLFVSLLNFVISFSGLFYLFKAGFWIVRRLSELNVLATYNEVLPKFGLDLFLQENFIFQIATMPKSNVIIVIWYIAALLISISFGLSSFISTQTLLFIRIKQDENDINLLKIS